MSVKELELQSGNRLYRNIPERVVKAIQQQQNMSERLIGWFQLGVVILFGLIYFASPKTFSAEITFELVPYVLAIYLLLTIIRLVIAYRGNITVPMLYFSVFLDMGLLLGMIWTFHLQYLQPPTFYLKSPTLLYVFIFIALRALRFEVRFVVAAGIVAATSWVFLAVNAYEKAIAQGYPAPAQRLNLLGRKVEGIREPVDMVVIAG